jgi:hypothetical protein
MCVYVCFVTNNLEPYGLDGSCFGSLATEAPAHIRQQITCYLLQATQALIMDKTSIDKRGMAWTIGQLDQWTKETLDNTTVSVTWHSL